MTTFLAVVALALAAYALYRVYRLEGVVDELIKLTGVVSAASHERDEELRRSVDVLTEQAAFAARRQHRMEVGDESR